MNQTLEIVRITTARKYELNCSVCGTIATTPTSRWLMVTKMAKHEVLHEWQDKVDTLAAQFNLLPLRVVMDGKMNKTNGQAIYGRRVIRLNSRVSDAVLENTYRHEVAHFLAATKGGKDHDDIWKACAVECGAIPEALTHVDIERLGDHGFRYTYECDEGCKWSAYKVKPNLEYDHVRCSAHNLPIIRYDV